MKDRHHAGPDPSEIAREMLAKLEDAGDIAAVHLILAFDKNGSPLPDMNKKDEPEPEEQDEEPEEEESKFGISDKDDEEEEGS